MIAVVCAACSKNITKGRERIRMEIREGAGIGRICDECFKNRKKKLTKKAR
jgi:hypothetical protein